MGDPGLATELKPLVVIITFLAVFGLITTTLPIELTVTPTSAHYTGPNYPEGTFDASNFLSYGHTSDAITMTGTVQTEPSGFSFPFNVLGSRDYDLIGVRRKDSYVWGLFVIPRDFGKWYNINNTLVSEVRSLPIMWGTYWMGINAKGYCISKAILDSAYQNGSTPIKFHVVFETQQSIDMLFSFNVTKYETPSLAWEQDELYVIVAAGLGGSAGGDIFTLIGQLLFFQAPNMHPLINAFIAIPIWSGIAYLIYVLLIKLKPDWL